MENKLSSFLLFSFLLGIISDHNAEVLRATFEHAISVANADLRIPLRGSQEIIAYGDSLHGYGRLCSMMRVCDLLFYILNGIN